MQQIENLLCHTGSYPVPIRQDRYPAANARRPMGRRSCPRACSPGGGSVGISGAPRGIWRGGAAIPAEFPGWHAGPGTFVDEGRGPVFPGISSLMEGTSIVEVVSIRRPGVGERGPGVLFIHPKGLFDR